MYQAVHTTHLTFVSCAKAKAELNAHMATTLSSWISTWRRIPMVVFIYHMWNDAQRFRDINDAVFVFSYHYMLPPSSLLMWDLSPCRFRGSSDRAGKQPSYGHARCSARVHERIYVLSTGLSKWPHIPPPPRICWQVREDALTEVHTHSMPVHLDKLLYLFFLFQWQHLWAVAQEAQTLSISVSRFWCSHRAQQWIPHGAFPAAAQEQRILHFQQRPWIWILSPTRCQ